MDNTTSVHSLGCAIFRTGRCNCAYLAQWDTPKEEPQRLGHKGVCLDEFWPGDCCCDEGHITDTICYHPKTGWHRDDNVACGTWDKLVEHRRDCYGEEVIQNGFGHSDTIHMKYQIQEVAEFSKRQTEKAVQRIAEAQRRVAEHAHVTVSPREEKVYTCVTCQGNQAWMDSANREIRLWKRMGATVGGLGLLCAALSVASRIWVF